MRLRAARRAWLLGLVAVGGALFLLGMSIAQEPAPGVTFRSESALLELEVKVTAKGKKPVHGLQREDFSVFENGEPQEIAAFEYVPSIKLSAPQPMGPDGKVKKPARAARPRPHTWMYVATHIGPHLRTRVAKAIREFVEEQMVPGVAVSLNGMPFVWDRGILLAMLDGRAGPDGKRVSLVDVQSGTLYSEQFDASGDGTMFGGQDIPRSAGDEGLIDLTNIRRSMTARAALYRYIDLVRQMGRLPGKKVVVLYSQGLLVRNASITTLQDSFEGELFDLYKRLSGEATRRRVSIYAVDARGLVATVAGGDSTYGSATAGDIGPASTSGLSWRKV